MAESGLKIHTCYTVDIRKQLHTNGKAVSVEDTLMSRTAEICLHALKFCTNAFLEQWDSLSGLKGVLRKRQAEVLIHSTVHSSAMYSDFDRKFPNDAENPVVDIFMARKMRDDRYSCTI